jgi:hypothetical protein
MTTEIIYVDFNLKYVEGREIIENEPEININDIPDEFFNELDIPF